MLIRFERSQTDKDLLVIKDLYEMSFPPKERREHTQLVQLLSNPRCHINNIYQNDVLAGLITFWDFKQFVYIEHFAIFPYLQGKGIGKQVIQKLLNSTVKPLLLEVEPPLDDQSKKRIKFYSNIGFNLLNRVYVQPSYDGVKPSVELRLMSTFEDLSTTLLDQWVDEVMLGVYFSSINDSNHTGKLVR
jgi:ribosomal protein S18 acetylase RimI-like enzyme